ncbi:DNA adenine methylase [Leptospira jelokensis]|uniref:DNA adenine methylase n=1 Tax=Leptospira jelokensis TaxID=2484931 RepID=A0A4Z0ZVN4_9LEPT|nr:DNA adenine methylase [Leptospira jelokensis]TGL58595.1 DNA adenine methylase [Leptospira jelokensis]
MISAPALKYNGGKFRLREWVISQFPDHVVYVELCAGSASVLLSKEQSKVEVLNDLDGNVTNFFEVLRDRPKDLIRKIEFTPYSEDVLNEAINSVNSESEDLERAYKFYCICWMSLRANDVRKGNLNFRAKGNIKGEGGHHPAKLFSRVKHLYQIAKRLKNVIILNRDSIDIIAYYDSEHTLFYLDLPYLAESRNTKRLYNLEFNQEFQHRPILESLTKIQGKAVVSHYEHPLYEEIFEGWEKISKQTLANRMNKCFSKDQKVRTEILYIKND